MGYLCKLRLIPRRCFRWIGAATSGSMPMDQPDIGGAIERTPGTARQGGTGSELEKAAGRSNRKDKKKRDKKYISIYFLMMK